MRVRFWGVRGSVPYATSASIGHGCNTPCIEIVDEATDRLLVLDAGSGIVGLGEPIAGRTRRRELPILLTHYHWDHVQGLPFFAPLYRQGVAPTVWAPALGRTFADLETMFEAPFFPVPYDRLPSRPAISMVAAGETTINGFEIGVQRLNHPGGAFAYRIRGAGGSSSTPPITSSAIPAIDDAARGVCDRRERGDSSTRTSRPTNCRRTRGGDTATGASARSSRPRAAPSICGSSITSPDAPTRRFKAIEAEARQLFAATDAAGEGDSFRQCEQALGFRLWASDLTAGDKPKARRLEPDPGPKPGARRPEAY